MVKKFFAAIIFLGVVGMAMGEEPTDASNPQPAPTKHVHTTTENTTHKGNTMRQGQTLKLRNGKNVKIIRINDNGVTIRYADGTTASFSR